MGRERNVGREIAFSLIAAVVLGSGLVLYITSSIDDATSSASSGLINHAEPIANEIPPELATARDVVRRFAAALAAKRYEDAYALMASPYRAGNTLAAFQQTCERSSLLASTQRGEVLATHRTILGGGSPGPYSEQARGVLVTGAGSIDATITLLVDGSDARILVLALAGVPVLDGISAAAPPP